MIATNNTGADDTDKIAQGVIRILDTARAKTGAKVLLLGVFPRGENLEKVAKQRAKITRINEVVSKLDDGKNVRSLDLKDQFLQPDGTIAKEICTTTSTSRPKATPSGQRRWSPF